jgi:CheY-like chemotaxis protein
MNTLPILNLHRPVLLHRSHEGLWWALMSHSLQILIVEDHRNQDSALSSLLQQAGHHVTTVDSGAKAIDAVRDKYFDVVLCDLALPDVDGCALLSDLLKIRSLKAIAIMAYEMEEQEARAKAAGFVDHIFKPVLAYKLFEMLDHLARKGDFPFTQMTTASPS